MFFRVASLAVVLFVMHCESANRQRDDAGNKDNTGNNGNNSNTSNNGNKEVVTVEGIARLSLAVDQNTVGNAGVAKDVGELFAASVTVANIDLAKIAADYEKKLMMRGEKFKESDLQVELSIVKDGTQQAVFEKFVKSGVASFSHLYAREVCTDCQLIAKLGSYGNRGCADDCDYPFVPIEPITEISTGVTIKTSPYALQATKEGTDKIKIKLTKNTAPVANATAELTACVYVPPSSPWGNPSDNSITYCSTPDFADYGGQQAIAKQSITLDANGSWSGTVDTAVQGKICNAKVYMQVEGRVFIEDVSC